MGEGFAQGPNTVTLSDQPNNVEPPLAYISSVDNVLEVSKTVSLINRIPTRRLLEPIGCHAPFITTELILIMMLLFCR